MFEKLKNLLSKDVCIEFTYYPRRREVVARVPIEKGIDSDELCLIENELKRVGFDGFYISSGECDLVEYRYSPPEVVFRSKEDEISRELLEILKHGERLVVCGKKTSGFIKR